MYMYMYIYIVCVCMYTYMYIYRISCCLPRYFGGAGIASQKWFKDLMNMYVYVYVYMYMDVVCVYIYISNILPFSEGVWWG